MLWTDDAQCHQPVPGYNSFVATLKLGMQQGLQAHILAHKHNMIL
jgi:hypothetical protein